MINQTHFDKQSLNCTQIYTMPVNIAIGSQDYKKSRDAEAPGNVGLQGNLYFRVPFSAALIIFSLAEMYTSTRRFLARPSAVALSATGSL